MSIAAHPEYALCLGGADCVWDDVLAWEEMYGKPWDGLVIAANDVGAHWPRDLHHWVTLHPNRLMKWQVLRRRNGFSDGYQSWGGKRRGEFRNVTILEPWSTGSSGMLAVQVAQHVGCQRAILCGIPMTSTGHFGESAEGFGPTWYAAAGHWRAWPDMKFRMEPWVRSMSGRTRELLGAPTLDWLRTSA